MWIKFTKILAKIRDKNFQNPGPEAPKSRSGGFWAALRRFLVTRDLPDASVTPSRRLWGGSWGWFWVILAHLGGVLRAQDRLIFLPRRPKMRLRCLQDSPRFDLHEKSQEKCAIRARMAFSIRFLSDLISKIHPRILKNHYNYIRKIFRIIASHVATAFVQIIIFSFQAVLA